MPRSGAGTANVAVDFVHACHSTSASASSRAALCSAGLGDRLKVPACGSGRTDRAKNVAVSKRTRLEGTKRKSKTCVLCVEYQTEALNANACCGDAANQDKEENIGRNSSLSCALGKHSTKALFL
eukprot:1161475-Pelagomonas_calceolata.AAC.4